MSDISPPMTVTPYSYRGCPEGDEAFDPFRRLKKTPRIQVIVHQHTGTSSAPFQPFHTMNLKTLFVAAALHLVATSSQPEPSSPWADDSATLWYDTLYDQKETSLSSVACSNGEHGLLTLGYKTFGDLPSFPFIGGSYQIQSWNSPNCGTCLELTYTDSFGTPTSLSFIAINTGPGGGFSISMEGLNRLTNGNAQSLDGLSITATQLPSSACGPSYVKRV